MTNPSVAAGRVPGHPNPAGCPTGGSGEGFAGPRAASTTHVVLVPSYNPGAVVFDTLRAARAMWCPVWLVSDGSTDGTVARLHELAATDVGLRILELPHNQGKGAALLHALLAARAAGFTHALTMDADGQHPAGLIASFMQASAARPDAMILGRPVFDASAPLLRVRGRRISNAWANLETLGAGIGDSLYGFRVYPIAPLRRLMRHQPWMRRFDFDPEAVVRLCWHGVRAVNLPAPVKYLRPEEGGVSHFNYVRDNALLIWMHLRLFLEFVLRLPVLLVRRWRGSTT